MSNLDLSLTLMEVKLVPLFSFNWLFILFVLFVFMLKIDQQHKTCFTFKYFKLILKGYYFPLLAGSNDLHCIFKVPNNNANI